MLAMGRRRMKTKIEEEEEDAYERKQLKCGESKANKETIM